MSSGKLFQLQTWQSSTLLMTILYFQGRKHDACQWF